MKAGGFIAYGPSVVDRYRRAARELGIVFGTMLGSVVLREGAAPQRLAGASIIVLGITLPALASSQRVQSRGSHCR